MEVHHPRPHAMVWQVGLSLLALVVLALVLASCGSASSSPSGGETADAGEQEAFSALSFAEAQTLARETDRLVFVDFYTTWCGPCKRLDSTTWRDAAVTEWLAENTVALKIDAEKETELAGRYRLQGYPTLLFLDPDGSEVKRLMGYHDADAFLAEARRVGGGAGS